MLPYPAAFLASNASKHISKGSRRNSVQHVAVSLISRAACGTLLTSALHIQWLPQLAVHYLYVFITGLFMGGVLDCFALLATALLGMRVAPSFDRPYMSLSLAQFWGHRWNVTTTYLLRCASYQ
jgi:D-alanyl-lipoteichoic acid acyltransferase DltB (MBOAT superfamily)